MPGPALRVRLAGILRVAGRLRAFAGGSGDVLALLLGSATLLAAVVFVAVTVLSLRLFGVLVRDASGWILVAEGRIRI